MAQQARTAFEDLFTRIEESLDEEDYKKCLKFAESILTQKGNDEDAPRVKLFALIRLTRYDDALRFITSKSHKLPNTDFEQAYCMWKLGRNEEALGKLQGVSHSGSLQLKALLLMRQGRNAEAFSVYQELLPRFKAEKAAAVELTTNALASQVMSGDAEAVADTLKRAGVVAADSFEVAFNVACAAVATGDVVEATRMLDLADRRGQEVLMEENATPADIERELAVVHAQQAHVAGLQGEREAALAKYTALLAAGLHSDAATLALCSNNVLTLKALALKSNAAPKDAVKKMGAIVVQGGSGKASVAPQLLHRLPASHATALLHNSTVFSLLSSLASTSKVPNRICLKAAADLADASPDCHSAMLIAAAAKGQFVSAEAAIAYVLDWLHAHPDTPPLRGLLLAAHVAAGPQPAQGLRVVQLLRSDLLPPAQRFAPAMIATRVAILERQGGDEACDAVRKDVEEALDWWQAQPGGQDRTQACCASLAHLASLALRQGDSGKVSDCFARMQEAAKGSSIPASMMARIARMLALADPAAAALLRPELECSAVAMSAAELAEAEELEISYVRSKGHSILFGPLVKPAAGGDVEMADAGADGRKRKRKRKPRYPKGFDPAKPGPLPDKERWLPKHERAEFKKRKKRSQKNQPVSKGAQGMGKVDLSLDKSGVKAEEEDGASTFASRPSVARSAPKGSQGKRKGRR